MTAAKHVKELTETLKSGKNYQHIEAFCAMMEGMPSPQTKQFLNALILVNETFKSIAGNH